MFLSAKSPITKITPHMIIQHRNIRKFRDRAENHMTITIHTAAPYPIMVNRFAAETIAGDAHMSRKNKIISRSELNISSSIATTPADTFLTCDME